jgi:hypothetical protein
MQVLLDVRENKALFLMELLNNFSFVKVSPFVEKQRISLQKIETKADIVVETAEKEVKKPLFAQTRGMWADRDYDLKKIRKERRERRTKYYDKHGKTILFIA